MYFSTIEKDPNAKLDYGINWSDWLRPGDTITASTWTVTGPDAALVNSDPGFTTTEATVWLAGGTLGKTYDAVNHITTAQGREDDRTLKVRIEQR
ncbi:phage fiber-tail adaptor protein [Gordonia insulae]|uniref:Uncharacterized protein n=1 Tax=Gordonia insulae TaxID=2420509 RepID=A0A3G8JUL5_9ACTN|nr:hypothetical protein [Gordonia insulae]AZG48854.1 hypothetical protein D7316_05477 [Gordonia insulae]